MNLNDTKTYLNSRANVPSGMLSLPDASLQKYYNTGELLLETFYKFKEEKDENIKIKILAEEMLFLYSVDFDVELFYKYEGLKQFNIGQSSVAGTVAYDQVGPLFSRIVKSLLKAAGIDEIIEDPGAKVKNSFTYL